MRLTYLFLLFFLIYDTSILAQTTASQQVTSFTIEAPLLELNKKTRVYLPKNHKTSEKSYPVINMHEGQSSEIFESSHFYFLLESENADSMDSDQHKMVKTRIDYDKQRYI